MNFRTVAILIYLLDNDNGVNLTSLLDVFRMTRRNLYYDMEKINYWLKKNSFDSISIEEGLVRLPASEKNLLRSRLEQLSVEEYVLSADERETFAAFIISTSKTETTLDRICDLLMISRNTGKSMIASLKGNLQPIGIQLGANKNGYYLSGNEVIIRHFLFSSLLSRCGSISRQYIINHLQQQWQDNCLKLRDKPVYEWIISLLYQCEGLLNKSFVETTIHDLAINIMFAVVRGFAGCEIVFEIDEKQAIVATREYTAAVSIGVAVKEKGIAIADNLVFYIAVMFLGARSFDIQISTSKETDIINFTTQLIDCMEKKMNVVLPEKKVFRDTLLVHIQPMYYRLKYGVRIDNPLEDEIRSNYPYIYGLIAESVKEVPCGVAMDFSSEEIAYLCVYFASWLKRHGVEYYKGDTNRILIICHSGMGTSLFLQEQLVAMLGNEYCYQIASVRKAEEYDFERYLLVISTIDLPIDLDNFMFVNPLLTTEQRKKIVTRISGITSISAGNVRIGSIVDIVKENSKVYDEEKLIFELTRYLRETTLPSKQPDSSPSFFRLFVDIDTQAHCEHTALEAACNPLVENNITTWSYLNSVESIIDTYGLYFEVSEGILLVHPHADIHMTEVALSLLLFDKSVEFKKYGRRISAMFAFTSPGPTAHAYMMKKLLEFVTSGNNRQRLIQCDFASPEQLSQEVRLFMQGSDKL